MQPERPTSGGDGPPPRCASCGSDATVRSLVFRSRRWPVWDCRTCLCSFVWPRPGDAELDEVYSGYGNIFELRNRFLRQRRDERYRAVLSIVEQALGGTGTLLDVGCSTGAFLSVAKAVGWTPVGVELDAAAVRIAIERTSLPVHVGHGTGSLAGEERFDVISMNHYIEHVREPGSEIAAAVRRLRQGGLLLLRTPNGGSRVPQAFGALWSWFTPPTHLTYFREESFRVVARQLGLSVATARVWRGDQYSTPLEVALAFLRGVSGPAGYSRMQTTRRETGGIRAITGLKLLDSAPVVKRLFSPFDDCELLVVLKN